MDIGVLNWFYVSGLCLSRCSVLCFEQVCRFDGEDLRYVRLVLVLGFMLLFKSGSGFEVCIWEL